MFGKKLENSIDIFFNSFSRSKNIRRLQKQVCHFTCNIFANSALLARCIAGKLTAGVLRRDRWLGCGGGRARCVTIRPALSQSPAGRSPGQTCQLLLPLSWRACYAISRSVGCEGWVKYM